MNTLLPWQQEQWRNVMERLRAASLPHAILLAGPGGLGKNRFAALLAQTLLCETGAATGRACGHCRSCLLYAADSHPDRRIVAPLEAGKAIVVDQVREAGRYLTQTSQYGGYKTLIITPADQMNVNAANSLLKTLEEPAAWSLILLVSDRPGRLPATVLSRCQRLNFTAPESRQAQQWLVEQIGVVPDIEVDNLPNATFKGQDAQLDAAIKYLLDKIKEDPRPVPPPPPYPNRKFDYKAGGSH